MGRATALAFAAAGGDVVAADIAAEGETIVEEIAAAGGRAAFVRTDVSQAEDVEAAVAAALDRFEALHCAVNAAAIENETTFLADCEESRFDRLFAVNV